MVLRATTTMAFDVVDNNSGEKINHKIECMTGGRGSKVNEPAASL